LGLLPERHSCTSFSFELNKSIVRYADQGLEIRQNRREVKFVG
jgi:hypothetical protein